MIAANLIILAFMLEPAESITQEPWDFVTPWEEIEPKSFEEIERELKKRSIRILEKRDDR